MNEEGMLAMLQKISSLSYGYEGRTELHLVGAFSDTKGVGAALLRSCLCKFNKKRFYNRETIPFIRISSLAECLSTLS
jgi:hypothetical protein